jgi:hypothetical protein
MERKMIVTEPNGIGFALGGLAGNNAHGAGFLQAALTPGSAKYFYVGSVAVGGITWAARQ